MNHDQPLLFEIPPSLSDEAATELIWLLQTLLDDLEERYPQASLDTPDFDDRQLDLWENPSNP